MKISVLRDCAILLQDLFHRVFMDIYQGFLVSDGHCFYEISNMLFLEIMSLCCVCSSGVNKRCSVGYVVV